MRREMMMMRRRRRRLGAAMSVQARTREARRQIRLAAPSLADPPIAKGLLQHQPRVEDVAVCLARLNAHLHAKLNVARRDLRRRSVWMAVNACAARCGCVGGSIT